MGYKEIKPEEIGGNAIDMIGRQWMLVGTKQDSDKANLMTASWGGLGVLWNKPSAFIFVRHSRYTHDLLESADSFSLTFYGEGYRKELGICGVKSGRDIYKTEACDFTLSWEGDIPYTNEAEIVLLCKKTGKTSLGPESILDKTVIDEHYPDGDFHDIYVGEIVKVFIKE